MAIWAIADLHLSFSVPNKDMTLFGKHWERHYDKIAQDWDARVDKEDIVLIPGDISWAMKIDEAMKDLEWIHQRPGTKVMIRGNHDHWWSSITKVRNALPSSIYAIGNDSITIGNISFAGARLWDDFQLNFDTIIDMPEGSDLGITEEKREHDEKIFSRELLRLQMSLENMKQDASLKIALTHYPPIGIDLKDSRASLLLERFGINHCVFGHLHSVKQGLTLFGEHKGITYHLVACDYRDFRLHLVDPRHI